MSVEKKVQSDDSQMACSYAHEELRPPHIERDSVKPFTTWSAVSVAILTTNSAIGLILTFPNTLRSGGSMLLFYGYPLMAIVGLSAAVTLAELAAAFPDAGGQYVWVARLSPPRPQRFLAYITAIFSWAGAVCTGASVCLVGAEVIFELVEFIRPGFIVRKWMPFLVYQAINLGVVLPSLFASLLSKVTTGLVTFTICLLTSVFVALFATTKDRRSASNFFTHFENNTGWSDGIAALIGANSMNWCFSTLDAVVHIADELPRPRENIPRALILSILIGFITGMVCILAFLFASNDYETQYSSLSIMYYAFHENKSACIAIQCFIFISTISAHWGIQMWQSRLAWTIGRNKGFPLHQYLSNVSGPPFNTPVWALLFSASCTAVLGTLYLASETAFSSLISAALLFQYISYAIPTVLLLLHGRSRIPHGRVWFPNLGYCANFIVISWTLVALVFYCFPYTLPAEAGDMNYVSVVLGIICILILVLWLGYGRRHFTFPELDEGTELTESTPPEPVSMEEGK